MNYLCLNLILKLYFYFTFPFFDLSQTRSFVYHFKPNESLRSWEVKEYRIFYIFQNNRAVNPLSQVDIYGKFKKYITVSIYHCHRGSFMKFLFIAYKNDGLWHFVVCIGSPVLLSFYCVCTVSFCFPFFFLFC